MAVSISILLIVFFDFLRVNVFKVMHKTIVRYFFNKQIIKLFEENISLKPKFGLPLYVCVCVCVCARIYAKRNAKIV